MIVLESIVCFVQVNGIHEMAEKIGKKLAEAESVGEAGDVDKSMELFKEVEELKNEKRRLEVEAYFKTYTFLLIMEKKSRMYLAKQHKFYDRFKVQCVKLSC